MPFPDRLAAPAHGRRRPDQSRPRPAARLAAPGRRRPDQSRPRPAPRLPAPGGRGAALIAGAALPAACLGLLATGASPAGGAVSGAGASTSGQHLIAPPGDRFTAAAAAFALAGLQSAVGFERALGLAGRGLVKPTASDRALVAHGAPGAPDPTARAIAAMTAAGDRIARLPYLYGGGHGSFTASGYDCSGSVSYVLHAAGLLSIPADSSGLESFGQAGPGRHVTIYANAQHALMTIDGRRYDTIAFQETGTRWSSSLRSAAGYVERHPPGM